MECITQTTLRGHCEYAWWNHFQNIIPSLNRVIKQVFPCFIRAPSDSNAKPIDQLYGGRCFFSLTTTPLKCLALTDSKLLNKHSYFLSHILPQATC